MNRTYEILLAELSNIPEEVRKGLEELKVLRAEKDSLIEVAKKYKEDSPLPSEIQIQMCENLEKMKVWNSKMKSLRIRSDELKAEIDKIVCPNAPNSFCKCQSLTRWQG